MTAGWPFGLRWWQASLLILGFWTLVGALWVGHEAVVYARMGRPMPWALIVTIHAVEWGSWALMTPLIYGLVRWCVLGRCPRLRALAIYTAAAVLSLLLNVVLVTAGRMALASTWPHERWAEWWPDRAFWPAYWAELQRLLPFDTMLFVWVTLAWHALIYSSTAREREVEAARLSSQLAEARLHALTMQLQPHFLFNTLNTISGLVTLDPRRADRMISRLADLLRLSLRHNHQPLVPLGDELAFLEMYLDIQQTRFDDRLVVIWDIEPHVSHALVPALLLQPMLENTIRHAVAPYSTPVHMSIRVHRSDARLSIRLRDDGPGLPVDDPSQLVEGVGLRNTRVRLQQLYGADHAFQIRSGDEDGVEVLIDLPWRAPAAAGSRGVEARV